MYRSLLKQIKDDLIRKMVIITGPRQVGKTTLAKMINDSKEYLNYDYGEHQLIIHEKSWDRKKSVVIFDELHKMKNWKSWLKGIYDVEGNRPGIVVTGSAQLDFFRKTGESMAGRYFNHRLHPFDIKEVNKSIPAEEAFNRLMSVGGFPEPFLENSIEYYQRWKRTHIDIILRQDLLDIIAIKDIKSIELLIQMLRIRVGSSVSYAGLARDIGCDAKTIKRWIGLLENLYIVFIVRPWHRNIARSILKEPKIYFYDNAHVKSDEGIKLENLVACALLKELHHIEDTRGVETGLYYLRTKDGREIDFAVSIDNNITWLFEVKLSDDSLHKGFLWFENFFEKSKKIQLVKNINREKTFQNGCEIRNVIEWLSDFSLL